VDVAAPGTYIAAMDAGLPKMIGPKHYPELKALVWNGDPERPIRPEEAFALYERNWRFVDRGRLSPAEGRLIEALTDEYGKGHLLV